MNSYAGDMCFRDMLACHLSSAGSEARTRSEAGASVTGKVPRESPPKPQHSRYYPWKLAGRGKSKSSTNLIKARPKTGEDRAMLFFKASCSARQRFQ